MQDTIDTDTVTVAAAAKRLGVHVHGVRMLAAEGRLDDAGPGLVTAASVDREIARRAERAAMIASGAVVTDHAAAKRLGVHVHRVWALIIEGRLDSAGRGLVTPASVDREVAHQGGI